MKSKVILILCSFLCLYVVFSCSSREEATYQPTKYGALVSNEFTLSIIDAKGNDLLTDKNFVNTISATGNLSKKIQTFSTIKWDKDGGFNFVEVYTDLPDEKKMNPIITPTTKQSFGSSTLALNIGNTITKLDCDFRYTASPEPKMYANSTINLIKIKIGTEEIDVDNLYPRNLVLVYENGTISVKK